MTTHPDLPGPAERADLNAAAHTTGTETGFWDHNGAPAPWPDDIDDWRPVSCGRSQPTNCLVILGRPPFVGRGRRAGLAEADLGLTAAGSVAMSVVAG
jgi:hypothetical protein